MKTLIVSIKTSDEFFDGIKKKWALAEARKIKDHYEVSFGSKKQFDKFIKNIGILSIIQKQKPKSVYELAKLAEMDLSNLNKIILFFEEYGVIKLKRTVVSGRNVSQPIVEYEEINFKLGA